MITRMIRNLLLYPYRPVKLSTVIRPFDGLEDMIFLSALVSRYLPESLEKLMQREPIAADEGFTKEFSEHYFPIRKKGNYETPIERYRRGIPVEWLGLDPRNYDSGRLKKAHILTASVCENPYGESKEARMGCSRGMYTGPMEVTRGSRIAVIDRLSKLCDQAAGMLQPDGYRLTQVVKALKGSPYPGMAAWCRWLFSKTGNVWLDTCRKVAGWDEDTVQTMAEDWKTCPDIQREMDQFETWLSQDFEARSVEVIEYIDRKIAKYPRPLADIYKEEQDGEN